MKLDWLCVKILDSTSKYNQKVADTGLWEDILLEPFVSALHAVGIDVYGYQFVYLYNIAQAKREAEAAIVRVRDFRLDGFIIDAEGQSYNKYAEAHVYANDIKAGMTVPVGLCSFRFPSYHAPFPWNELLLCATFHCPQVYWAKAHNPADQLQRSYNELMELKKLPFVPTGSAYDEFGWKPTIGEINEFNAKAQEMKLPGITWWEWFEAIQNDFEISIGAHVWDNDTPIPPKDVVLVMPDGREKILTPGRHSISTNTDILIDKEPT